MNKIAAIHKVLWGRISLVKVENQTGSCNGSCWKGSFTGTGRAFAYNLPGGKNKIYLCPRFFDDSQFFDVDAAAVARAQTLVHEAAHEIGMAGHARLRGKRVSGETVRELAEDKPARARKNPENFASFFAAVGQRGC